MLADRIRKKVLDSWPGAEVVLEGEGCNFRLTVRAEAFRHLSRLERQKRVYGLFKEDIQSGAIHALSVHAGPPS